jgi:LuxR family quorum-sensing transcriptional regulator LasR
MYGIKTFVEAPAAYLSEAELAAILHARDWAHLQQRALHALEVFGVDDFVLRIDTTLANGDIHRHVCGTLPDELLGSFREEVPLDTDPVGRRLLDSGLPCEWDIDELCGEGGADSSRQLRACGIKCGISMVVRTERAATRIDFCRTASRMFVRSAALRAHLMLLAAHLHEAAKALALKEAPLATGQLTERELECLRYCASGKTGKEIGAILGISQRTVYFHMKNIARKFNVYSTRHAIGRAVAVGLIKPGE